MRKIDEVNIKKAQNALNKLIKVAGKCEDSAELQRLATDIFSEEGLSAPLIKRACEAFNSNKSVYKLSSAADPGADFALLSSSDIINAINKNASAKELKKVASLHPKFYANPVAKPEDKPMEKAAAAPFNPAAEIELDNRPTMGPLTILNTLKHQQDVMSKLAFAQEMAETNAIKAEDTLRRAAGRLDKRAKSEVCSICKAYYGEFFNGLDKYFETDLPLRKFASIPAVPTDGIYQTIEECVGRKYLLENYKRLNKVAAQDIGATLKDLADAYIEKSADFIGANLSSQVNSLLTGTAMGEALGIKDTEGKEISDKILNENVQNVLRELEMKRNFYEIYADDYISTFPVHQVQDAYNNAIQKLPEKLRKHPASATQLIRSWVTKQLSHGGVPSAEDATDIMEAEKSYRRGLEDYV